MVIPAGTETRRELLRASAALLAVAGTTELSGCGSVARRRSPHTLTPSEENDVDLLNFALAAEQRAIAVYTAVTPLLSGYAHRAASTFLAQDLNHAGELRALLAQIGGPPHEPSQHYPFGTLTSPPLILSSLIELEQAQIRVYLAAIGAVSSGRLRQSLASILADDAQHVAVLRAERGSSPLSGAFVTA